MPRSVSIYEGYWQLIKNNRGKTVELRVPAEFHERVVKALRKRKGREHATTTNYYPEFVFTRNPTLADGTQLVDVLWVKLPQRMIDTI